MAFVIHAPLQTAVSTNNNLNDHASHDSCRKEFAELCIRTTIRDRVESDQTIAVPNVPWRNKNRYQFLYFPHR